MVMTCTSKTPVMPGDIESRASYWAKRLECPVDEDANYRNTFWCNRDLIPIPEDRRTWTWQGFAGYWVICGYVSQPETALPRQLPFCSGALCSRTVIQHQHDGMDGRLDVIVSGLECTSGDRLHGRSRFDLCSCRRARGMARESSLPGIHRALAGFLGHERWFLASA